MNDNPLVSIMIPTYNQAKYIKQAIDSALQQDFQKLEVIVSDDCSSDDTREVVVSIDDPRLRYYRNSENIGRVANYRKMLYEYCRGDYVLNLDGDDYLFDMTYVRRVIEAFEEHPELVFAFSGRFEKDENSVDDGTFEISKTHFNDPVIMDGTRYILSIPKNDIKLNHLTAIYKRKCAIDIGFYQCDIISSDYESLWRLAIANKIAFLPGKVAVWRRHGLNASTSINIESLTKNYLLFETVKSYAISKLDKRFERKFQQWFCLNVAHKLYTSSVFLLKKGNIEEKKKLQKYIRAKWPSIYLYYNFLPKKLFKETFFTLRYYLKTSSKYKSSQK